MEINKMFPLAGINNVASDAALVRRTDRSTRYFVREALNGFVTDNGKWQMREGVALINPLEYRFLWRSVLQNELFAQYNGDWVKLNPITLTNDVLTALDSDLTGMLDLNGKVVACTLSALYVYNGREASILTIETPAAPYVTKVGGSLPPGDWALAISYLRANVESALSPAVMVHVKAGGLQVQLPQPFDTSIDGVRLYVSTHQGGVFYAAGDHMTAGVVTLPSQPARGVAASAHHLEPMPGGRYLSLWRGRLVVARGRTLHFSEPLNYHLHDPLHGFVQLPQRITFVTPVDAGLWVGQVTGVVFLRGATLSELALEFKGSQAPVTGSASIMPGELAGEYGQSGLCAIWLATNGHVVGTAQGALIEPQAGVMTGITAKTGHTFFINRRVITVVTLE